MAGKEEKPQNKTLTNSVVKAFRILDILAEQGEIGVTELARTLNMHKATVYRFLLTMKEMGYLKKDLKTDKYSLTLKLFELGSSALGRLSILEEARPVMKKISENTAETIHLAVLEGGEVVYIEKFDSPQTLRMYSRIGRRAPAYCTGLGKALLAWAPPSVVERVCRNLRGFTKNTITDPAALKRALAEIRKNGYSTDNEEHEDGIRCVAAPIKDLSGEVVAALSISGPSMRFDKERVEKLKDIVIEAASEISGRLGYHG